MQDREGYDVCVIGAGGAGFAAAIAATVAGGRVLLIEKNPRPGGSTALSVGSITATRTPHQFRLGIQDSSDEHYEDMEKINARRGLPDNPALRRLLTENITDTFHWLLDLGVEFIGPLPEPPHRHSRMHCVLPTSKSYIAQLTRRAEFLGVEIRCGFVAQSLLTEEDRVVGVSGIDMHGNSVHIRARATVLATGDFSGNAEYIEKYISARALGAIPVNPTNTGDGHRMALALGAHIRNGEVALLSIRFLPPKRHSLVQIIPQMRIIARLMRIAYEYLPEAVIRPFVMAFITSVLQPAKAIYQSGAILVNRNGQRFGDETGDLTLALSQQPEGVAFLIFDRRIAERFSHWPNFVSTAPGAGYAYISDYRRHRGDLWHQSATIEGLARSLDVPKEALIATVSEYNTNIADGDRLALSKAPFCALGPLHTVLVFTDGGLAVDTELRVLNSQNQPIPGLYAAGSVGQGGMLLDGHGHHIGWAFTSGRIAGRHAYEFSAHPQ